MPWDDAAQIEGKLEAALEAFNWSEAEAICRELEARIRSEPEPLNERTAKYLLQILRRKRRFNLITSLAEALIQSGLRTPQIRRQYAQALIDQGNLAAPEMVLQSIIQDSQGVRGEELEARGLIGRIYKQLYLNNQDPSSQRNRANLERALSEYLYVYRLAPATHLWHGINVVALLERARRDHFPLQGLPDSASLARDILQTLEDREAQASEPPPTWDLVTAMEASVALGRNKEAADLALRLTTRKGADAFEIYSTLRQLTEVWQLNEQEPPGDHLLPILKAGYLRHQGATISSDTRKIKEEAATTGSAINGLEAIFGADRMATLKWYRKGLEQCNSVARIEKLSGQGHGTGWLVDARDFFPDRSGVLLLTNSHVVSPDPNPYAIFPEDCQANFQALQEVYEVEPEVIWTSPYPKLDATFLALKGQPSAPALRLYARAFEMADPAPRMYIIGHPQGRDLELSLQDNQLLATKDHLLHYRTPTEPGSSGSPVFEPQDWRVVALHHRGSETMRRIDGKEGTYQANEGIGIPALQKATRNR